MVTEGGSEEEGLDEEVRHTRKNTPEKKERKKRRTAPALFRFTAHRSDFRRYFFFYFFVGNALKLGKQWRFEAVKMNKTRLSSRSNVLAHGINTMLFFPTQ